MCIRYLAINVHHVDPSKKMGDKWFTIDIPNNRGKVLVFGWLLTWNSHDTDCYVRKVADSLNDDFFKEAFATPDVRLIVCLCHIPNSDEEVALIRKFMNKNLKDVPVVMLTGHSHLKRTKSGTDYFSMESDHYMYHVGLLRFNLTLSEALTPAQRTEVRIRQQEEEEEYEEMMEELGITEEEIPVHRMYVEGGRVFFHLSLSFLFLFFLYISRTLSLSSSFFCSFFLFASLPSLPSHLQPCRSSSLIPL